jgi:hypothetical protein
MSSLRGHYSRDSRRGQGLAFLEFTADDCFERRRSHLHMPARDRLAPRDRLLADIDHPDSPATVEMRQSRGGGPR